MKASTLLACAALALSGAAHAADDHDHGHEHTPLHGGVVVEASDVDFELVAKPEAPKAPAARSRCWPAAKRPKRC